MHQNTYGKINDGFALAIHLDREGALLTRKIGITSLIFITVTLFLKISGLLRDMTIAFYFGDSYLADAYLAAFIIPNMLFLFMINGMKNALVPGYIDAKHVNQGKNYLNQILKSIVYIGILFGVLGALLSPVLIRILYPSFNSEATSIAVNVSIILFAALIFVGINSVMEAYLDAENLFSLSAFSQMIVILSSIAGAILFAGELSVYSLALGYLVGSILSLVFKVPVLSRRGMINLKTKLNLPELSAFYGVFIPVAMTVMVGQINLAVDNVFASYFQEGVVTYINYAKNLVHFPQQIFGITIATIMFPMLAKAMAANDEPSFKRGIENGLNVMYLVVIPAIVGMFVLMPNIISLVYQRGAFSEEAVINTSEVAYYYFGSVLFFSLNNVSNKGLYTLKKGHYVLIIGLITVVLNAVFNYIFTTWMGYVGIPLASSAVGLLYALACYIVFSKTINGLDHKHVMKEFTKITLSVIIMGVATFLLKTQVMHNFNDFFLIMIITFAGALLYIISIWLFKVKALKVLITNFRKKV